ncbi:MAG: NYN domain-containing protein [Candidatus Wallbacteria bacterium HGW-Wallbacteria-1]|jgi:uncharacterized LabA/DUF88 family protein|uniref:NYN domain-containing protein n=1 Tax=Candidatus Wallbacteria bacterium HGW-Wallbacteria-1 TaxID=2013854 RepID=A0A2N1PPL4_9BACT|nr:MAG: NYN domain-containing protein [Candidatus Wallbacteria bacterium HGW-Wallbacteria-1]
MGKDKSSFKVGVFVDSENVIRNGGYGIQYDVLREFACRNAGGPIRLNTYVAYDSDRARTDTVYRDRTNVFYSIVREFGFKVIKKKVRWYFDDAGNRYSKANSDLDMAVDLILQARNLDQVVLVTGDGDFAKVVSALQNEGCYVEVIGFDNVSSRLRNEADKYISGYVIPQLLPVLQNRAGKVHWGAEGSIVRGYCYKISRDGDIGFMRYLKRIDSGLWITDSRDRESPYGSAPFRLADLGERFDVNLLPDSNIIFEFKLMVRDGFKEYCAENIQPVNNRR